MKIVIARYILNKCEESWKLALCCIVWCASSIAFHNIIWQVCKISKTSPKRIKSYSKMNPHKTRNILSSFSLSLTWCRKIYIDPTNSVFSIMSDKKATRWWCKAKDFRITNYMEAVIERCINTYNNTQKGSVPLFCLWDRNEYDFYTL